MLGKSFLSMNLSSYIAVRQNIIAFGHGCLIREKLWGQYKEEQPK